MSVLRAAVAAVLGAAILAAAAPASLLSKKPAPSRRRLSRGSRFRRGLVWSARFAPDGQTIVYGAAWDGAPIELFSPRAESPESRPLGLGSADVLAISPPGEMAISLNRHFVIGWENSGTLAQVPLSGGAPREILENVSEADWSPDGKTLAIVHEVGGKNRLEFPIGKVLYETAGWVSQSASPAGATGSRSSTTRLAETTSARSAVVDSNGKKTTSSSAEAQGLAWTPSGKEIWLTAGGALRAISLSGAERVIARVPGGFGCEDISRDGRLLVAHGNTRREIAGLSPGGDEGAQPLLARLVLSDRAVGRRRLLLFEEQNRGTARTGTPSIPARRTVLPPPAWATETRSPSRRTPVGRSPFSVRLPRVSSR